MDTTVEGLLPVGRDRVREHSSPLVNERIDRQMRARLQEYASRSPEELGRRLAELEHEWDIDRALMANFALLGGLTSGLALRGASRKRRPTGWLYLFGAQLGFLLVHALVGWCPPAPVFRRLGFRTQKEIEAERCALLQMLGERGRAGPAH